MALRTAGRGGRRRAHPGRSLAKSGAERRPPSHSRVSGSRTLGALPRAGRGRAADSVPNVPLAHTETGQRPGGELGPGGQLRLLRTRRPAAAARPGAEGPGGSLPPARVRTLSPSVSPAGASRASLGTAPVCRAGQHPAPEAAGTLRRACGCTRGRHWRGPGRGRRLRTATHRSCRPPLRCRCF